MADTSFDSLIRKEAPAAEIAAYLNGLDETARLNEVRSIPAGLQPKLWKIVEGKAPITLAELAPQADRMHKYAGKNSMPAFNKMQKRVWRPASGAPVVGYNHQLWMWITGPGYFTTQQGEHGEVVFAYVERPTFQPPGWPAIKGGLLNPIVYGGRMIDYAWRVSEHTVIGATTKMGKDIGVYFTMTRVEHDPPGGW